MQPLLFLEKKCRIAGPLIAAVFDWWRRKRPASCNLTELDACDRQEVERMADRFGMSATELRMLASQGPPAARLLPLRMAALRLDPQDLAWTDGPLLRDMQQLCATCESHGRCRRDLARDPDDPVWEQYCPNADVLGVLRSRA
jgi:hypothetical protein